MAVINLTEPTDILGHDIALKTAKKLNFVLIDGEVLKNKLTKKKENISNNIEDLINYTESSPQIIKKYILSETLKNNVILLNLGGEILLNKYPGILHVNIISKPPLKSLPKKVKEKISIFKKFIKTVYGINRINNDHYDLQIKIEDMDTEFATELILKAAEIKAITAKAGITWRKINKLRKSINNKNSKNLKSKDSKDLTIPDFAHPSEREFARALDYYRIRWEYEPTSFILEKDERGEIKEEFTPDFYLKDINLYIELTTMKQKLVTKKNRKIRKLKQLYPDVNIKIFYGKDYEKLLHRFGIKQKKSDSK